MKLKSLLIISALCYCFGSFAETQPNSEDNVPCPPNWTVENNASVENSLSYINNTKTLAINVTYIGNRIGDKVSATTYAQVASQKLACSIPVQSNLIKDAWTFYCDDSKIEAIVYGPDGNLVLLSIAGRSNDTEEDLKNFINFLNYQAKAK